MLPKWGGSSTLILGEASPVRHAAKLAKITMDQHWEEVWRAYDPKDFDNKGRLHVLSNSTYVRAEMYGFKDPSIRTDYSREETSDEFINMLACMLLGGVRENHSSFTWELRYILTNRAKAMACCRAECRRDIARALCCPNGGKSLPAVPKFPVGPHKWEPVTVHEHLLRSPWEPLSVGRTSAFDTKRLPTVLSRERCPKDSETRDAGESRGTQSTSG